MEAARQLCDPRSLRLQQAGGQPAAKLPQHSGSSRVWHWLACKGPSYLPNDAARACDEQDCVGWPVLSTFSAGEAYVALWWQKNIIKIPH